MPVSQGPVLEQPGDMGHSEGEHAPVDRAIVVVVPEADAEVVGAVLMDRLGPFSQEPAGAIDLEVVRDPDPAAIPGAASLAVLAFYPETAGLPAATVAEVVDMIPESIEEVYVDVCDVDRDWQEGWKDHFTPMVVEAVRIRPPWEEAATAPLIDVVIDPGMGFGTGLHPTTRGVLAILSRPLPEEGGGSPPSAAVPQVLAPEGWTDFVSTASAESAPVPEMVPGGGLVDVGTGSGILAIAAAKLGWDPILAFDNDPIALEAAAQNVEANGVGGVVRLLEADASEVDLAWFDGATVFANMTLDPVVALLKRLAGRPLPVRLIVAGILAGEQEVELLTVARASGLRPGRRVYEAEWVGLELIPIALDSHSDGMGAGDVRALGAARRPEAGL
jgi:ribosomal protein L11 methyltransferase